MASSTLKLEESVDALAEVIAGGRVGEANNILYQIQQTLNHGIDPGRVDLRALYGRRASTSLAVTTLSQESFTLVENSETVVAGRQQDEQEAVGEQHVNMTRFLAAEVIAHCGLAPALTNDFVEMPDMIDDVDLLEDLKVEGTLKGLTMGKDQLSQGGVKERSADKVKVDTMDETRS